MSKTYYQVVDYRFCKECVDNRNHEVCDNIEKRFLIIYPDGYIEECLGFKNLYSIGEIQYASDIQGNQNCICECYK